MAKTPLVKLLEDQLNESEAGSFEVGEQRENNHKNYSLQPLGNEISGRSQYISPDVLDSVEAKKAIFSETFFSGRRVVKFSGEDMQEADKRTSYVEKQLKLNKAYELFRDGWHDAFVAKRMNVVADWEELDEEITVDLEGASQMVVMQILQNLSKENGEIISIDQSEMEPSQDQQGDQVFSGPLKVKFDTSRTVLTLVEPEKVHRDPTAAYPNDGQWYSYEIEVAKGDLIKMGFDEEQVRTLSTDYRYHQGEEDSARKAHDRSWTSREQTHRSSTSEMVTLYRSWAWIDLDEEDPEIADEVGAGFGLYHIYWTKNEIMRWKDGEHAIKHVSDGFIPAFEWTEMKISHAEHGLADADLTSQTQRVQSTLKRLIIDNQQMRNTSRYEAVAGAIKNPRELMDNNIGGIVWTRQAGSVSPLATPELSPLTLAVIQMLNMDKESRSGQSSLSKGMNMEAISNQNADDMIERLTNAGQRRVMRAARDFAQTFMIPLCQHIYRLGVRNDKRTHKLPAGGEYTEVMPQQWPDTEQEMEISVALTPDQCEKHAKALMAMYQFQMQDPTLQLGFGYEQRHRLLDDIYDCLGVPDSSAYLLRPDDPKFLKKQKFQADQLKKQNDAQQMQAKMAQAAQEKAMQMQMNAQQFDHWVRSSEEGRKWAEHEIDKAKADIEAKNILADNIREDQKLSWDIEKGQEELEIEREQKRGASIGN